MEFLKAILGDALYAQFEQAITAYNGKPENAQNQVKLANLSGGQYVSKGKYDTLDATNKTNEQKLTEANTLIEQLQKAEQPGVDAYKQQITDLEAQIKQVKIDSALKCALISANVSDHEYISFKLKEMGDLELDEKGSIKGIDQKMQSLKIQHKQYFQSGKAEGRFEGFRIENNPFYTEHTKEAILHMTYDERVKLYMNNPQAYTTIMKG